MGGKGMTQGVRRYFLLDACPGNWPVRVLIYGWAYIQYAGDKSMYRKDLQRLCAGRLFGARAVNLDKTKNARRAQARKV